jgi:hypothetical protein
MIETNQSQEEVVAAHQNKQRAAQLRMLNLERRLMEKIMERKDVFDLSTNVKVSLSPLSLTLSPLLHQQLWMNASLTDAGDLNVQGAGPGQRRPHGVRTRGLSQHMSETAVLCDPVTGTGDHRPRPAPEVHVWVA